MINFGIIGMGKMGMMHADWIIENKDFISYIEGKKGKYITMHQASKIVKILAKFIIY